MRLSNWYHELSKPRSVLSASASASADNTNLGFDNSWYHAKTEFNNNYFIIHFSHNSSSETEAKRSAILFLRRTLQGLSNQADVELDMINVISAADITFIMSSSQAIVNWLNALDQSDFSKWVWCIIPNNFYYGNDKNNALNLCNLKMQHLWD